MPIRSPRPARSDATPRRTPPSPAARHRRSSRRPIPTTKCARSCAASSTRCATACRSNAWPCSYGGAEPYARLVHEHLELAGIAHNGVSVRTLADSRARPRVARLLALPDDDFRRDDVFALLAAAPGARRPGPASAAGARGSGSRAGAAWSAGLEQWQPRLDAYARARSRRRVSRDARSGADVARLRAFVDALAGDLDADPRADVVVGEAARWAHRLVRRWIGDDRAARDVARVRAGGGAARRGRARPARRARRRRGGARRSTCSGARSSSSSTPRATASAGSARACSWLGRLRARRRARPGLRVRARRGRVPRAAARRPAARRRRRAALGGELPLRADRVDDDHRALLAALACDDRRARAVLPARRPAPQHRARAVAVPARHDRGAVGRTRARHATRRWCTAIAVVRRTASRTSSFPATAHELDVRAVLARRTAGSAAGLPSAAASCSRRVASARRSRASTATSRTSATRLREVGARRRPTSSVSATRLETWASCPHAYFVQYVLQVEPVERPEEHHRALAARPRHRRARGARPVPRRAAGRRAPTRIGLHDDRRRGVRTARRRAGSRGRRLLLGRASGA